MTAASTSGAPTAASSAGSTGPSSTRNGTLLRAANDSGVSTESSRPRWTWTASTLDPVSSPIRKAVSSTGRAAAVVSRAARTMLIVVSFRLPGGVRGKVAPGGWQSLRCSVGDAHEQRRLAGDPDPLVIGVDADGLSAEAERETEGGPRLGQAGVDGQSALPCRCPFGVQAEEAVGQGLPHATHRRQVETASGGAGEIVEVEAGRHAKQLERPFGLTGAGQQGGGDGRGERAAVGGPWFVEGQARAERPGHHLFWHQVVEHQHVGLLDELGAGHSLRHRAARRPRPAEGRPRT